MDISGFFDLTGMLVVVFFVISLAAIVMYEYEAVKKES